MATKKTAEAKKETEKPIDHGLAARMAAKAKIEKQAKEAAEANGAKEK